MSLLPVHDAALKGDVETIERLVREGADIDERNPHDADVTPMHYAAENDHPEVIEALVRLGSKAMGMPDKTGWLPFTAASFLLNLDASRTFVALGMKCVGLRVTEDEAHEVRWRVYFRESFVQKLLRETK
jgi:ankyrin repeat protein